MKIMSGMKLLAIACIGGTILGFSTAAASSANISKSYRAVGNIPTGSLVSLSASSSDSVEPATTGNAKRLIGVVVPKDDSLLAVDAADDRVQVATSGTATVAVSDFGGSIKVGDQIMTSPFRGVGMKAGTEGHILGLAQTDFDARRTESTSTTVRDKAGNTRELKVGHIRLSIGIAHNAKPANQQSNSIQRFGNSLTGRPVSTFRIVISMIIAAVALIILITLVYSAIYGSIISVGRNPLGSSAVYRTLSSVIFLALLTAVTASVSVYLLLR